MLSANARASATPACDTIPVPSAVTCRPFSQPVVFTYQVLLDLGRYGSQQPLSFQVRSTFHGCRTGQLSRRREFSGLAIELPAQPPERTSGLGCRHSL